MKNWRNISKNLSSHPPVKGACMRSKGQNYIYQNRGVGGNLILGRRKTDRPSVTRESLGGVRGACPPRKFFWILHSISCILVYFRAINTEHFLVVFKWNLPKMFSILTDRQYVYFSNYVSGHRWHRKQILCCIHIQVYCVTMFYTNTNQQVQGNRYSPQQVHIQKKLARGAPTIVQNCFFSVTIVPHPRQWLFNTDGYWSLAGTCQ